MAKKNFKTDNVGAGQEYVKAYADFIHYVERLYEAAKHPPQGHYPESEGVGVHKEER